MNNAIGDVLAEAVLVGVQPSPVRAARWCKAFAAAIETNSTDARPLLITIASVALAAAVTIDAGRNGRAGLPAPPDLLDDLIPILGPKGGPR
jgi:hypothetical protein